MRRALRVILGALIPLTLAVDGTSTPRSYPDFDDRIAYLKNYFEGVKANVTSSTYLMGQGRADWQKERLVIVNPFEQAAKASKSIENLFLNDQEAEAEALKQYRLTALTTALDFANFTSLAAKNFYRPIGRNRECGLYPPNVLQDEVAPALESTLDTLASYFAEMRRSVADGSYKAEEQGFAGPRSLCKTFDIEAKLETLQTLIQPGCENTSLQMQVQLVGVAKQNNMTGGNENGCLQVFIARYTQSAKATALFKNTLDKYIYLAVTIQGFCYPLIGREIVVKEKYLGKSKTVVKAIRTGMSQKLDASKLNDSVAWPCDKQRTIPTVPSLPTTSASTEKPGSSDKPYNVSATEPSSTTTIVPTKRANREEVKKFVTEELDRAGNGFATKAWASRIDSYQTMINNAVDNVRKNHNESLAAPHGSVEGIMFLPYGGDDDEQQCLQVSNDTVGDQAEEHRYNGADFFVRFTYNVDATVLSQVKEKITESKDALLDAAFSPKGGSLCKRLMDAIRRIGSSEKMTVVGKGGFSAVAAVKCGRQFVWYQLGYRYFAGAGVSNKDYVTTSGNVGTYDANCGQIMFFP